MQLREEQVLASNELVLDATIWRSGYWQAMNRRWTQYREERVLASNELALDATSGRSGFLASNELALDAIQGGAGIGKQCTGAGCDEL